LQNECIRNVDITPNWNDIRIVYMNELGVIGSEATDYGKER